MQKKKKQIESLVIQDQQIGDTKMNFIEKVKIMFDIGIQTKQMAQQKLGLEFEQE